MKKVSSIDTDDILYQLITQAVSQGVITISGKVCPQGERPDGSTKEDIVINTITVTHEKPQSGTSNVNIYAADKKVSIDGTEQYKANRERLREIGDALTTFLDAQNIAELEFMIEQDVTIKEIEVRQHYRNLRISWNIH